MTESIGSVPLMRCGRRMAIVCVCVCLTGADSNKALFVIKVTNEDMGSTAKPAGEDTPTVHIVLEPFYSTAGEAFTLP